jgi:hypothetical protein
MYNTFGCLKIMRNSESPRKHPEKTFDSKIFKDEYKNQGTHCRPRDGAGHLTSLQVGPDLLGFVHLLSLMAGKLYLLAL